MIAPVATANAVAAWIAQRARQRAPISELADEAQRTVGHEPSERLAARVLRRAVEALGSEERALRWLAKPNRSLGGTPQDHARTPEGAEQVMGVIGRVEHGVNG